MNKDGAYYATTYEMRFGSWNDAVEGAGLEVICRVGVADGPVRYGSNWSEQREKALERDGWECRDCGTTNEEHLDRDGQGLHVHHLTKRRKFDDYEEANRLENLVTLCRDCHAKWEKRDYGVAKESKKIER
jgi:5-methylcytosine-specific restriction endonuclease McrA